MMSDRTRHAATNVTIFLAFRQNEEGRPQVTPFQRRLRKSKSTSKLLSGDQLELDSPVTFFSGWGRIAIDGFVRAGAARFDS